MDHCFEGGSGAGLYAGAARLYLFFMGLGTLPNPPDGEGGGGGSELLAGMCLYPGAGWAAARAVARMAETIRHCNKINFQFFV